MTSARRLLRLLASFAALGLIIAAPASAAFGLDEADVTFHEADGSVDDLAGSHPFAMTTKIGFNTSEEPVRGFPVTDQDLKDLSLEQIDGLAGDPTATPRCSAEDFLHVSGPVCPDDTAVGFAHVEDIEPGHVEHLPVYNVAPPSGAVAKLGFAPTSTQVSVVIRVSPVAPYRLEARLVNVPQVLEIYRTELTLWGLPADPAHDAQRGGPFEAPGGVKPFLTVPSACKGSLATDYAADSWENRGSTLPDGRPNLADPAWVAGSVQMHDDAVPPHPMGFEGCAGLGFEPSISQRTTSGSAESPTGLNFSLDVSNPGLVEPGGRAGSVIEKAVVTLPPGVFANPAVAQGLSGCSLAEYETMSLGDTGGCPDSSKVGSVEVESPLLEEEVEGQPGTSVPQVLHGQIFVAQQHDNVFGNLLTIYMVIEDPKLGIFIKLPGRVQPDPATGQLTTTFGEPGQRLPQLPFSHLRLHFQEGNRAPLMTPPTCGTFSSEAVLYPYAEGVPPAHRTATFEIGSGAYGAPCASSSAQLPGALRFSAGTLNSKAGTYSPFVLDLSRPDGSRQLSAISTTLPEGLIGRLAGIPYCGDAQIAAAAARAGEGQGAAEAAQPSCPAASEVGTVTVGAGAGPEPLYVAGHAYLAGPYKGAPLSLEIITPAIAGPFDLGVVAVRAALQVDPLTAQVSAVSDPIPTILHGLPLDVRSVAIDVSRPNFTLNPTSCEPKAITGTATSTLGSTTPLSQYFQASNCAALAFRPKLKLSLKGSTKHGGHPALNAVLTYPKGAGYANIARAQVNLPHSEFIDQANLNKTCTKPVLLARACPKSTIYGKAKAWTPLLDKPLEGNVYLVGGFGYKLPALVAELDGQIRVLLAGKVDSGPNRGIRNTFEAVPDAPVEKFELQLKGGPKYSLLENSENLCARPQKAIARFTAQSGKVLQTKPRISNECRKRKSRSKKSKKRTGKDQGRH
jgi:hypothetical protein